MPTTITNQARLQFTYGTTTATAASNIATTVMHGPLTAAKSVFETAYRADSDLTYIINLMNTSAVALTNLVVTDDLGTYAISPTLSVTPLRYIGPAQLYINGAFSTTLTPTVAPGSVAFTIPALAAGAVAMILYKVDITEFAPLQTDSEIENEASITAAGMTDPVADAALIRVADYADIRILKAMSPNPVTDGTTLTYTFTIQNYGNTDATDVILMDAFLPAPYPINVTVGGITLAAGDYDYTSGTLTLPGAASSYELIVPAADIRQNTGTGVVTINPSTVTIVVTGTI